MGSLNFGGAPITVICGACGGTGSDGTAFAISRALRGAESEGIIENFTSETTVSVYDKLLEYRYYWVCNLS